MLSTRLVHMIEEHAEALSRDVVGELTKQPRTEAYRRLPHDELHQRVYDVYHNLGRWLGARDDATMQETYGGLGRRRREEGIPLSHVVWALILTKERLRDYIAQSAQVDSAVALYQEEELNLMLASFFDRAIYFVVIGYEGAA